MKHKCSTCGNEYELGVDTLPICPHCVKNSMKYPGGITPKHTPTGAAGSSDYASYIADGIDPNNIFDYMTQGTHPTLSGCKIYYSTKYNSLNAVSYKPLGDIPGSGTGPSGPHAAEFAVLQDIEGKSRPGPHWSFEERNHLQQRINSGHWVEAPKCATCMSTPVLKPGYVCLNCQASGGSGKP